MTLELGLVAALRFMGLELVRDRQIKKERRRDKRRDGG